MHKLLRRRFIIVVAVGATLLRHGAANSCAVRFRLGVAADIGGVVSHDVHPPDFVS
jgi:hypothetical protein